MASKKDAFAKSVQTVINSVRRLKDDASGKNLSRLHRVESELMTVAGRKRPATSKKTAKKKKRTSSKK